VTAATLRERGLGCLHGQPDAARERPDGGQQRESSGTPCGASRGSSDLTLDFGYYKPQIDLWITKTDRVCSVVPGMSTTYTIVVGNNGPGAVTGR